MLTYNNEMELGIYNVDMFKWETIYIFTCINIQLYI